MKSVIQVTTLKIESTGSLELMNIIMRLVISSTKGRYYHPCTEQMKRENRG